jgi:hypothetical protein
MISQLSSFLKTINIYNTKNKLIQNCHQLVTSVLRNPFQKGPHKMPGSDKHLPELPDCHHFFLHPGLCSLLCEGGQTSVYHSILFKTQEPFLL